MQRYGEGHVEVDPARLGLMRGGGKPLPRPLLAKMEAAFGADFSAVRVHVGPQAAKIGALAFTTGNDLYFAPGQYRPESIHGQQLIGHELAHVIQQRQGRVRTRSSGMAVVLDRALEAEADRLGARAANLAFAPPRTTADSRPSAKAIAAPPAGCGCGCSGGGAQPKRAPGAVQMSKVGKRGKAGIGASFFVPGKGRRNAPRGTSSRKDMTKRQIKQIFDYLQAEAKAAKPNCRGARPTKPLRGVWNGSTRPGWSAAALAILPGVCAACGAAATDRDHIVPYRIHISNNAAQITICDGTCHFLGISSAEASLWSSDLNNLQPLCAGCNGAKAALDRARADNVDNPPTPAGPCPNAPNGCGGGACQADVCL